MDSVTHFLSKNVYFNICHGKNSEVIAVDKFQKFKVDTPLNRPGNMRNFSTASELLMNSAQTQDKS